MFDHVVRTGTNGGLLAVVIPEEDVERYGIVRLDDHGNYVEIVEKPRREAAPSLLNYGSISINVLPGTFLRIVDAQMSQPKEQGEYYVTDALNDFVGCGEKLGVYVTDATYLDCGTVESWVVANTYMLHSGGVSS